MIKAGDYVLCKDASGPSMWHLEQGRVYQVESVEGVNIKLKGVAYTTKLWRFQLVSDK